MTQFIAQFDDEIGVKSVKLLGDNLEKCHVK